MTASKSEKHMQMMMAAAHDPAMAKKMQADKARMRKARKKKHGTLHGTVAGR